MKNKLILLSLVILGSCKSPELVMVSEVSVVSSDYKQVYFKESDHGTFMYKTWLTGIFGNTTEVLLLNEEEFEVLVKKIK
jgi:hypothetical protein